MKAVFADTAGWMVKACEPSGSSVSEPTNVSNSTPVEQSYRLSFGNDRICAAANPPPEKSNWFDVSVTRSELNPRPG